MVRVIHAVLGGCLVANLAACCLPPANGAYQTSRHSHYDDVKQQSQKTARKQGTHFEKRGRKHAPSNRVIKTPVKQAALKREPKKVLKKSNLPPLEKASVKTNSKTEDEKAKEPTLELLRSVDDLQHPQSITFDKKRLRFYVSQLGEKVQASTGSIALLARDGSVINNEWIKGLDQPRGMAMVDKWLYIADGKSLLKVNVETAKVVKRYEQPNAFYLYDVSASKSGEIFVTDPLSNSILKLASNETLSLWLKDKRLEGPNSLALKEDKLYVSSIGLKSSSPQTGTGKINQIQLDTKKIMSLTKQNNLKKISSLGLDEEGTIYATSLGAPNLMRFSLETGKLIENIDVQKSFDLKETQGLADFLYFPQSKEFWVPVKNNGHILVFVRGDATLLSEGNEVK